MSIITLNDFTTITSLVIGSFALTLGALNYFRDKAKIIVELSWDMTATENDEYDSNKLWGVIYVTNIGRRPIYISHAALSLPKGYKDTHLLIMGGIKGKKLTEADPTEIFIVDQSGLEVYAKDWIEIVAQVSDTSGRVWKSNKSKNTKKPSWAE